jgi:hypothetical protein
VTDEDVKRFCVWMTFEVVDAIPKSKPLVDKLGELLPLLEVADLLAANVQSPIL